MKPLFLILLGSMMFVPQNPLFSQPGWALDKGSVAVGGTASVSVAGGLIQGFNDKTTVDLKPFAYWFTSPNVGVGGELYLSSSSRKDGESSTTIAIGPSVLLAFADSSYTWYPFLQLGGLFASVSEKSPYVESGNQKSGTGFALELGGGGTYMLGRRAGITVQLYYQAQWITIASEAKTGKLYGMRVGVTGFIF